MNLHIADVNHVPRTYAKNGPHVSQLVDHYIHQWEKKRHEVKEDPSWTEKMAPQICFSRQRGVGALEIADILAKKIGVHVVDREVLEFIARKAHLDPKKIAYFDERFPG
jgi:hypothetical protein